VATAFEIDRQLDRIRAIGAGVAQQMQGGGAPGF